MLCGEDINEFCMALTEDLLLQGSFLERCLLNFHGNVVVLKDRQTLSNTVGSNLWHLNLLGLIFIYAFVI